MTRSPVPNSLLLVASLIGVTLLHGCGGNASRPLATEGSSAFLLDSQRPAPIPGQPADAVRFLTWCWDTRNASRYAEILTADFHFVFAAVDSAGNAYRDVPFTREDELVMARHLFAIGTATLPPARSISVRLGSLASLPDPRPGKTAAFHRVIRAPYELSVVTSGQIYFAKGALSFFVVRGDSAAIPDDLVAQGFGPDPTRWWIEHWVDETLPPPAPSAELAGAVRLTTWAEIKTAYR